MQSPRSLPDPRDRYLHVTGDHFWLRLEVEQLEANLKDPILADPAPSCFPNFTAHIPLGRALGSEDMRPMQRKAENTEGKWFVSPFLGANAHSWKK